MACGTVGVTGAVAMLRLGTRAVIGVVSLGVPMFMAGVLCSVGMTSGR